VALQHIKVLRHWVKEPDRRVGETDQETMDIFKRTNKMVSSKKKTQKQKSLEGIRIMFYNKLIIRGRIFSCVGPFYEQAVSNRDP